MILEARVIRPFPTSTNIRAQIFNGREVKIKKPVIREHNPLYIKLQDGEKIFLEPCYRNGSIADNRFRYALHTTFDCSGFTKDWYLQHMCGNGEELMETKKEDFSAYFLHFVKVLNGQSGSYVISKGIIKHQG